MHRFVCTPRHATYTNVRAREEFTVSFPLPETVVVSSLAATAREEGNVKPNLAALTTFPASVVDGVLVEACYLYLECTLDRVVEGFGDAVLVVGRVVAAHVDERALRISESEDAEIVRDLPLLAYLSPGRFARIADTDSFPFPAHFSLSHGRPRREQGSRLAHGAGVGHVRVARAARPSRIALARSGRAAGGVLIARRGIRSARLRGPVGSRQGRR